MAVITLTVVLITWIRIQRHHVIPRSASTEASASSRPRRPTCVSALRPWSGCTVNIVSLACYYYDDGGGFKHLQPATRTFPTPRCIHHQVMSSSSSSSLSTGNPCLSSPCQNRGTCFNVGLFFKCQCAHKFAGEVCDIGWLFRCLNNLSIRCF